MIQGSKKGKHLTLPNLLFFQIVGEIFYCGKETTGTLKVLPGYLGTAVAGFGGGTSQVYVIEGTFKPF
jgi:hypothetical protein